MRRALLTALLIAPSVALAQVTITETGDKPDEILNIAECGGASGAQSSFSFEWSLTTAVTLKISDRSGCPEATSDNAAHTSTLNTFPAGTTASGSFSASDIATRLGVVSESCGAGSNITVNVCVFQQNSTTTTPATGTFLFDRARPPTPTVPSVTPGDGALRVSWTAVSGSNLKYRVEARPSDTPDAVPVRSDEITGDSVRLGGVEVGRQYDVVVIAISQGGNESAPSPVATGTPVVVDDFWRLYRNAGGGEEGGCSTTGGASLALLAFIPFALRRRRS